MELLKTIFNIIETPPPPPPEPPPLPKPKPVEPTGAGAKIADQNQLGIQWKNKLERLERAISPVMEAVEKIFDSNNPSAERILQIAQANAPLLVLPPGNLPADPQEYIANSRLRENVPVGVDVHLGFPPVSISGKDNQFGDNTNDDLSDDFSAADVGNAANENTFLDLDNEMRGQLGNENAPVFYQFQAAEYGANGEMTEPPRLTYHIFHAFNDGPTPLTTGTPIADHEGDWERVTYKLNAETFQPETAILSAHEDENARVVSFESLKNNPTNRPLVYVAGGSHANYEKPGKYSLPVGAEDRTAADLNGDGTINETDGAVIFDTARNLSEVTSQDWYARGTEKGVYWGEISATQNFDLGQANALLPSGPQGPSSAKGAVEP